MPPLPRRVAVLASGRTPFARAGGALAGRAPLDLATRAVRGTLARADLDPGAVEALTLGVVLAQPGRPNLAREVVFEAGLPAGVEAFTVSAYCVSGLRAVTSLADAIALGRVGLGVAAGVEVLSGRDDEPGFLREPSTGLTLAEHMQRSVDALGIAREEQDAVALASHRNAVAARARLDEELLPLDGLARDTGPLEDTSAEALAALPPAFDPAGTLTAGNSSPVTDGAAAVVLASEDRARALDVEPLAFVRASLYGAVDPADGLMLAPGVVVPELLAREGVALQDLDRLEVHEAFGAQVVANLRAWEEGWRAPALGPVDRARLNVNGGTLALGHPWSATGGRLVGGLAHELARSDARLGLVSACAGGATAGALLLERG